LFIKRFACKLAIYLVFLKFCINSFYLPLPNSYLFEKILVNLQVFLKKATLRALVYLHKSR
jgi:hypothetical protein